MTEEKEITAQTEHLQSDKMRNTKIGKLLLTMSLPAIISMLVQALYNIVDSIFLTTSRATQVKISARTRLRR